LNTKEFLTTIYIKHLIDYIKSLEGKQTFLPSM